MVHLARHAGLDDECRAMASLTHEMVGKTGGATGLESDELPFTRESDRMMIV